jgi:hypothetical protein
LRIGTVKACNEAMCSLLLLGESSEQHVNETGQASRKIFVRADGLDKVKSLTQHSWRMQPSNRFFGMSQGLIKAQRWPCTKAGCQVGARYAQQFANAAKTQAAQAGKDLWAEPQGGDGQSNQRGLFLA